MAERGGIGAGPAPDPAIKIELRQRALNPLDIDHLGVIEHAERRGVGHLGHQVAEALAGNQIEVGAHQRGVAEFETFEREAIAARPRQPAPDNQAGTGY